MSSQPKQQDDQRVARALGLKVPVYRRLRDAIDQGESLAWLRLADPGLAGVFPNPLGFELLIEHLEVEVAFERRRTNLLRQLEGKDQPELEAAIRAAESDGEIEDLQLRLEPSPPPDGWEAPAKEEHHAFLLALRGDGELAASLRRLFRDKAMVRVVAAAGQEAEARRLVTQIEQAVPLEAFPASNYLALRRAEHAHVVKLQFELPRPELEACFEREVKGWPPQERDSYLDLFLGIFQAERLPRLIQEARARLKRKSESLALQQAWPLLENALDRGRHDGPVLGVFSQRNGKCVVALVDGDGRFLRAATLSSKAEDLPARLATLLGEERPTLVSLQADSPTRTHAAPLLEALAGLAGKPRTALVPVAVAKTLLREVARRLEEAHLSHDERQAALLARLAYHPRAMALHTPHVVRSFVPFRGEVNSHRLDAFEGIFLQSLLASRGVDVNTGGYDELRLVPGIDARAVAVERSTAPFRSLEDFQHRMALPPADWRAACCFLRVRGGDDPLDLRPLHPVFYAPLRQAAAAAGVDLAEVLKDGDKFDALPWDGVLEAYGWSPKVVELIRRGLIRGVRRPRRLPPRVQQGIRIEALEVGARLTGRISKLVEHGAFVDVGARREGFVHISELAERFVKDPAEVVQVGQEVSVRVLSIDLERQRFRLSMREQSAPGESRGGPARQGGGGGGRGGGGGPGERKAEPGERKPERGERRPARRTEEREPDHPAHVRSTRPKTKRPSGRPGGDRDERRGREERVPLGRDPRGDRREEIDPTNPFFQFFQAQRDRPDAQEEGAG